ncbi:MAG: ATP-binding protein [Woeseia sp.]
MAGKLRTLAARLIAVALAVHALLLPALFFGVMFIVEKSHREVFVNDVRTHGRFLADMLSSSQILDSSQDLIEWLDWLDSVLLGSNGVYAEVLDGEQRFFSTIMDEADLDKFQEDFHFGEHGDDVYYLSMPLDVPGHQAILRLGFDEGLILEEIRRARTWTIYALSTYLVVSLLLLVLLAVRLTRPLKTLQRDSRAIASGDYDTRLRVASKVREFRELATDLDRMRDALVGINERLRAEIAEHVSTEQQRQTLQSELHHAQRLETVGTLAGGIAHEFNNILVPIILYTDLALEDLPQDSPIRGNLKRVMKSANRAKEVIDQILTFSRKTVEPRQESSDVVPIVNETLTLVRALMPATINIQTNIDEKCGRVLVDATEVQQLIMNLCSNAFQAMTEKGGQLTIDVCDVTIDEDSNDISLGLEPDNYVRISVGDSGKGIDPAIRERIFEPFFTTREVGEGTGLGLPVVRGIVISHGGDISVDSTPGHGSTFHVYLPQATLSSELPAGHS